VRQEAAAGIYADGGIDLHVRADCRIGFDAGRVRDRHGLHSSGATGYDCKQLAQQAMETIFTARETANLTWDQIQSVGGAGSSGIFRTGLQAIKQPGTDGIYGTINDGSSVPQTMTLPGPDGIVGTADDTVVGFNNYQRSITISNTASADLRSVAITIQYTIPTSKFPKTYVLSGLTSQYR
jgi:hypothetical protein